VRVIGAGVDVELAHHLIAETVLRTMPRTARG